MATVKISTENNQIVFTDSTGVTYPYSQSSVDGRYNDTEVWFEHLYGEPNSFPFLTDNGYKPEHFLFADVLDADGVSLVDRAGVQTYLSDKMGSVTAAELATTGAVSTVNSTETLLTSGSTFTGEWEDVSQYRSLVVAAKTDQDATFTIQFSPDGVNQDSTLTRYYRTNQIEAPHRFTITRKYARIVFTNTSASDQTFLRLQTLYGAQADLNAPMDSTLAQDFDAVVTRPTDFHAEVALGRRQGAQTWNKFGFNDDIDIGTELIASWGGTFQYLTSGETIDIVSSSTADDLVGTGAQRIVVTGVDENWEEQIEVVEMDGTSTVTTTTQWIGINRVSIFKAGSSAGNVGDIDVTATTSGYQMAQMPAGDGSTQQMIFYVPANQMFLAEWINFNAIKTSGGGNPELIFRGIVYSDINTAEQEVYRGKMDTARMNDLDVKPPVPFPISEKSILWFTAETDSNSTQVSGRLSGELVRDVDA